MATVQLPWSSLPPRLCTCCSHCLEGLVGSHITLLVPIHPFGVSRDIRHQTSDISPGKPSLTSQNWIRVALGHPYGKLNSHSMLPTYLHACLPPQYCKLPKNKEYICFITLSSPFNTVLYQQWALIKYCEKNQRFYVLNAYCVPA